MAVALADPSTLASADGTVTGYQSLGSGEGVIVASGTQLTVQDYLPLAQVLAPSSAVHVPDRHGRGASGLQGR